MFVLKEHLPDFREILKNVYLLPLMFLKTSTVPGTLDVLKECLLVTIDVLKEHISVTMDVLKEQKCAYACYHEFS